ncbi:hypothetical protein Rhow_007188 [Rhodococcus wratislaviensis]|uniref:Uncharacterized protein n=1 Tax=Rhodococcus wratislaviensis TaxID=44752 RepID=A0A402CHL0_RHOWR|nr:hypothetical protein Rhow_007188 [Rhodococcus wratislaviensis]
MVPHALGEMQTAHIRLLDESSTPPGDRVTCGASRPPV